MAHVSARIAVRRRTGDLAEGPREQIREHAFGLDYAAVAKARLARSFGETVDESNTSAARLKRKRRRDADNSSAKYDDINCVRGHGMVVFLTERASRSYDELCSILDFCSYRPRFEGTNRKRRRR
jgi:hypothetical protein